MRCSPGEERGLVLEDVDETEFYGFLKAFNAFMRALQHHVHGLINIVVKEPLLGHLVNGVKVYFLLGACSSGLGFLLARFRASPRARVSSSFPGVTRRALSLLA